jgi:hypothetical protein
MLREIRSLAGALAGEFGTPQRVADEIRLHVRRADLVDVRGIYYPPDDTRPRAALLLDGSVDSEARAMLLLHAVAHTYLRHRSLPYYEYGAEPLYDAPRDRAETTLFVREFLARTRQVAMAPGTLRALRRQAGA